MYQKQIVENQKAEIKYDWMTRPIGQIQWKNLNHHNEIEQNISNKMWGAGCLISDDTFLTAGSCLDPLPGCDGNNNWFLRHKNTSKPLQTEELAPLMTVNFRYPISSTDDVKVSFDVLNVLEYRLEKLNYALLKLDGKPGQLFGKINLSPLSPAPGTKITIPCFQNSLVYKTSETSALDETLYYLCYQLDAELGTPIVDPNNKTIVGIHTTHYEQPAKAPQAYSGVTIDAIRKASKILQNKSFGFFSQSASNSKYTNQSLHQQGRSIMLR